MVRWTILTGMLAIGCSRAAPASMGAKGATAMGAEGAPAMSAEGAPAMSAEGAPAESAAGPFLTGTDCTNDPLPGLTLIDGQVRLGSALAFTVPVGWTPTVLDPNTVLLTAPAEQGLTPHVEVLLGPACASHDIIAVIERVAARGTGLTSSDVRARFKEDNPQVGLGGEVGRSILYAEIPFELETGLATFTAVVTDLTGSSSMSLQTSAFCPSDTGCIDTYWDMLRAAASP